MLAAQLHCRWTTYWYIMPLEPFGSSMRDYLSLTVGAQAIVFGVLSPILPGPILSAHMPVDETISHVFQIAGLAVSVAEYSLAHVDTTTLLGF
jgi:hypothetical protein